MKNIWILLFGLLIFIGGIYLLKIKPKTNETTDLFTQITSGFKKDDEKIKEKIRVENTNDETPDLFTQITTGNFVEDEEENK